MVFRAFVVWLVIAGAEILLGILRVRFLNPRVGDHRARQIGVFSGSAVILVVAWFAVPWIGAHTVTELLAIGFLWLALMLAFDITFGRAFLRASWQRIAADFDVRRGGLLGIGMSILFVAPLVVGKLKSLQ